MQQANARMVDKRWAKGSRGGRSKYLGSRQLEGPQEVGCLLESWSNCVDLVDKIFNADDVVLA